MFTLHQVMDRRKRESDKSKGEHIHVSAASVSRLKQLVQKFDDVMDDSSVLVQADKAPWITWITIHTHPYLSIIRSPGCMDTYPWVFSGSTDSNFDCLKGAFHC